MSRGERLGNHRRRIHTFERQPRTGVGRHRVHCGGEAVQQELHGKKKRAHPAHDDDQGVAGHRREKQQVRKRDQGQVGIENVDSPLRENRFARIASGRYSYRG